MKAIYFSFILLCVLSFSAKAQQIGANAELDTNSGLIGDQIKLSLEFTFPSAAQAIWPLFNDTLTKDVEIISHSVIDSTFSDDRSLLTLRQILTITAFDSGMYRIPPIEVAYTNSGDTGRNIFLTQALELSISTLKVDTAGEYKDIKPPLKAPLTWKEILPWVGAGLGVLLLIGFIIYMLVRFRKKKPLFGVSAKPAELPHVKALRELEKLRTSRLWQQGKYKEFFVSLSEIVRVYIDERFGILAMEMITEEILTDLNSMDIPPDENERLRKILILADMVKFAKFNPLPDECQNCLQNSVSFVQNTKIEQKLATENELPETNRKNSIEEDQDVHPMD